MRKIMSRIIRFWGTYSDKKWEDRKIGENGVLAKNQCGNHSTVL